MANLKKCDNCGNRNIKCFCCEKNSQYRKTANSHDVYIRNKAIEEFSEQLKEKWIEADDLSISSDFFEFVDEIAESMKGEKG